MEDPFYAEALAERGIEVVVPDRAGRAYVDGVIYDELVAGQIRDASRRGFLEVAEALVQRGAEGIVLGCTEIPLLLHQEDAPVPLLDTTAIHAEAALRYACH
jgi:aspartate racemase